jgi:hypothetical protein
VALALVAFAIPLCRRSIVLADEGYILLQAWDMLNGKVLYRDMDAFVTPGMWVVLAGTFKLLGPSVIASRVPVLLALLGMYAASYRITARVAGPRSGLAVLAMLAAFTVWAFPGWTFAFYSPFSVTFALIALERLLSWRESRKVRDLLLCGALAGMAIVFKQNYGVFALIGLAIGVLAVRAEQGESGAVWLRASFRDGVAMAVGMAAVGLPIVAWLALEGALPAAWHSLVVHPFEFSGRHDIAYLPLAAIAWPDLMKSAEEMLTYAAQPVYRVPPAAGWLYEIGFIERMHVPLYWAPPVILALGAALSYRPDEDRVVDAGLLSVIAVAGMVFLGVFPRADFNHLTNVYQPIIVAGAVLAHRLLARRAQPPPLAVRIAGGAGAFVLALYVAVAAYWYFGLIQHLDTPIGAARAGVLVRQEQARRIDYQVWTIQAETEPGEALLTVPDLSMLNFLADRPMPSAYYNLYEHHIAHDAGAAVVAGAEQNAGRLAITRFNDFFSDRRGLREYAPVLVDYLSSHYDMSYKVGREDFIHLERRDEPRTPVRSESISSYCDTSRGYQSTKQHLLFPALYHDPGTGREMEAATVETLCVVPVPAEGGIFSVRIGVRAPVAVAGNTTLTVEVLVIGRDEKTLVGRKVFDVEGDPGLPQRESFDPEFRFDLSDWAGREVRLLLRTIRRGRVLSRPLERRNFGTVFEDPRIIHEATPPVTRSPS